MKIKQPQELVYHFRPEHPSRPVLLLGAGASFKAGVPLAAEMVNRISRFALAMGMGIDPHHATNIMEGDVRRFLSQQEWFKDDVSLAEFYPQAVEHLLVPRKIRQQFFRTLMQSIAGPTAGHRAMADLVQRQLISTILTTNFDGLIESAMEERAPHIRKVITINKSPGDLVAFTPQNHPQVVYLHGSFDTYCDKNTITETQELDKKLVQKLRALISYAPIVVVGYRGYEPCIMQHLLMSGIKDSEKYSHGIFWCARDPNTLHENVRALADKIGSNFSFVKIDGFDEVMEFLNGELEGAAAYQVGATSAFDTQEATQLSGDSTVESALTQDDLERDQLVALCTQYAANILKTDFKIAELESFLVSYGFAKREHASGTLRPTLGLYLLVGKNVSDRFPYVGVLLITDGKRQTAFKGNLLQQFANLRETLLGSEVNPVVRIKRPEGAIEIKAYHDRAIIELLVNLMTHRDYSLQESSLIEFDSHRSLSFIAPGGLLTTVFRKLKPDQSKGGEFQPQQNVRAIRNPIIAEVFFSQGYMDKAGTGMTDVVKFMQEHYGATRFTVERENACVRAALLRAAATGDAVGNTANPILDREIYQTNLLAFVALPKSLFTMPLDPSYAAKDAPPWFDHGVEDPARDVVFSKQSGQLFSFADFRNYDSFARRVGYPEYVATKLVSDLLSKSDDRRIIVNLLHRHFERLLRSKAENGFFVEGKEKRAYFIATNGEGNSIVYDSPQRRGISRGVVKRRETPRRVEHENEGIAYSAVQHGDRWAIQVKPFYVFTGEDGRTPLPGHLQTSRATKRYKFDRNKAVEADMKFWSIFLAGGRPLIDLGGSAVPDLVISATFLEAEALPL